MNRILRAKTAIRILFTSYKEATTFLWVAAKEFDLIFSPLLYPFDKRHAYLINQDSIELVAKLDSIEFILKQTSTLELVNCTMIWAAVFGATKTIFHQPSASRILTTNTITRKLGLRNVESGTMAGTMADVHEKMIKKLGLEEMYTPIPKSREHLTVHEPKLSDLPPRSMQDSFTSAIIPLSQSIPLQEKYVAFLGHVRLGRLMEDMDMFAVWVSLQHIKVTSLDESIPLPYTIVTILVDKVEFTDFVPKANEDIRLSGHVCWVGKTSMEVVVWLEQLRDGTYHKITRALFLMAARNATNTGGAPINPLNPATEEEKKILSGGEMRKKRRQQLQTSSLAKVEPNDYEQHLMHNLFTRTTPPDTMQLNVRSLPPAAKWMEDSSVINTQASFPEHRNNHNKVFGGYLMKNALEISWVAAYLHCKHRPKLDHICDISFRKPVDVSSFIKMTSHVVYTEMNYVQIMTLADVIDPLTGSQETSNVFFYTFRSNDKIQEIIPRSYHEAIWYLEGRRKFKYLLESK